jgi:nuclear protein localization family protein 4
MVPGKMCCRVPAEDEMIPAIITKGKTVKEFDSEFFMVSLANGHPGHDKGYNILKVYECPKNGSELRGYLRKYKGMATKDSFANFELLLYLAKVLDINTALGIAEDVANETNVNEFTYELVDGMANAGK